MSATASPASPVRFDVGGCIFKMARSTIDKFPNSLLGRMVSQEWNQLSDRNNSEVQVGKKRDRTEDSAIFIDRDPKLFELVLQVYRNGRIFVPAEIPRDLVAAELEYFCVDCCSDVFVTHWNLCDQMKFEKSFEKSADAIMEEIVSASEDGKAKVALQQKEAASELETARKKALAASDAMKDGVLEIVGQGIAILILSKLKAEKSFVKTIKIVNSELTTSALDQKLSANGQDQPLIDGLMSSLFGFREQIFQNGETEQTFWKLKTAQINVGVITTIHYWDVTNPSLLAIVNRQLVAMKMKAEVTEDADPYYQNSSIFSMTDPPHYQNSLFPTTRNPFAGVPMLPSSAGVTITLSALQPEALVETE